MRITRRPTGLLLSGRLNRRMTPEAGGRLFAEMIRRNVPPDIAGKALARMLQYHSAHQGLRPESINRVGNHILSQAGIVMVEVPAGDFIYQDGQTVHLPAFRVSKDPVTNGQYQTLMDTLKDIPLPRFWFDPRFGIVAPKGEDLPVVGLGYTDVALVHSAIAKMTKQNFLVMSEEHAERIMRGTRGNIYPWGDEFVPSNCVSCTEREIDGTMPVGSTGYTSPDGIREPIGNVWIWTRSTVTIGEETFYVRRGGSWCYKVQDDFQGRKRHWNNPKCRRDDVGFRLFEEL